MMKQVSPRTISAPNFIISYFIIHFFIMDISFNEGLLILELRLELLVQKLRKDKLFINIRLS